MTVPTLYARMELSLTEAEKRLAKFNRDLDKTMGANERRTQAAAAKMQAALSSSTALDFGKGIAAGALAGIAGLLSLTAVIGKVKDALNEFGDIADKSAAAGLNPETFQEYAYAASLAGVEVNEISAALATFAKNAGLAEIGKGKMVAALKKLNPELLANLKATESQEERLKLAVAAIDAASAASQKAALASVLFGDAGTKLVGVFKGGAAAMAETAQQARSLGIIISGELIDRADELGDQFDTATRAIDLQFKAALIDLAPLLVDAARFSAALAKAITETVQALRGIEGSTDGIAEIGDGFNEAAEETLKFVAIIVGALSGRAIGGLIAKIPAAVRALQALAAAMTAGAGAGVALSGLAGPIGLIIGIATTAALVYADWGDEIDAATRALADQAASGEQVVSMIDGVRQAQDAYRTAIQNSAKAQTAASNSIVADTKREFEAKKALLELELKRQQALIAVQSADLAQKSADLKADIGAQVATRIDTDRTGFSDPAVGRLVNFPDDITGLAKTQAAIDASPITDEIKKIRAEQELTVISAGKLKEALDVTFAEPGKGGDEGTPDVPGSTSKTSAKGSASDRADEFQRAVEQMKAQTSATMAQTEAQRALNPLVNDYGFTLEKAKAAQELLTAAQKAGRDVTPALRSEIDALAGKYAEAEAASKRLAESQEAVRQSLADSAAFGKDLFGGAIQQMRDGASAGEIFSSILDKIQTKIIDMSLNQLFDGAQPGSGQGVLGALFRPLTSLFAPATPAAVPTPTPAAVPVGPSPIAGAAAAGAVAPPPVGDAAQRDVEGRASGQIGTTDAAYRAQAKAMMESAVLALSVQRSLDARPRTSPAAPVPVTPGLMRPVAEPVAPPQPVMPRAIDLVRPAAAESGRGAGAPVTFNPINNASVPLQGRVEERSDGRGGRLYNYVIDDAVAGAIRDGSAAQRTMQRTFGVRRSLPKL